MGFGWLGFDVVVCGLGVSGSSFAYLASRFGFRVLGFDVAPFYGKACGDVVTIRGFTWWFLRVTGSVLAFVRRFDVRVSGSTVAFVEFKGPVWAMVDKGVLVNTLRSMAEGEGATIRVGKLSCSRGPGLRVDARGPYAHDLSYSILTLRFKARARWEPELALIDFDVGNLGFYWIFPLDDEGRLVNIGAGFKRVRDARLLAGMVKAYYRRVTGGNLEILDTRGAPVAVYAPIRVYENGVFKVGEAAGLINSTSGEGNRYALQSGVSLALALRRAGSLEDAVREYWRLVEPVVEEIRLSRMMLSLVEKLGPTRSRLLLESIPKTYWAQWLSGRIPQPIPLARGVARI